MALARCTCGNAQFEVSIDGGGSTAKELTQAFQRGILRIGCPKCGQKFARAEEGTSKASSSAAFDLSKMGDLTLDPLLEQVEKTAIMQALGRAGGNRSDAARLMGISRSRLYRRLDALGIPAEPEGRPSKAVSAGSS